MFVFGNKFRDRKSTGYMALFTGGITIFSSLRIAEQFVNVRKAREALTHAIATEALVNSIRILY